MKLGTFYLHSSIGPWNQIDKHTEPHSQTLWNDCWQREENILFGIFIGPFPWGRFQFCINCSYLELICFFSSSILPFHYSRLLYFPRLAIFLGYFGSLLAFLSSTRSLIEAVRILFKGIHPFLSCIECFIYGVKYRCILKGSWRFLSNTSCNEVKFIPTYREVQIQVSYKALSKISWWWQMVS